MIPPGEESPSRYDGRNVSQEIEKAYMVQARRDDRAPIAASKIQHYCAEA